jgi:hypothetical protein
MGWDTQGGGAPGSGNRRTESTPIEHEIAQVYANLGWVGMIWRKCFGILVDREGGGVAARSAAIAVIADIAGIARDRKSRTHRRGRRCHTRFAEGYTTRISGFPCGSTSPISTAGTLALFNAVTSESASERATDSSRPPAVWGSNRMVRISSGTFAS